MSLREEFENTMADWVVAIGKPVWDEENNIYVRRDWQMAWVAFRRTKLLYDKDHKVTYTQRSSALVNGVRYIAPADTTTECFNKAKQSRLSF